MIKQKFSCCFWLDRATGLFRDDGFVNFLGSAFLDTIAKHCLIEHAMDLFGSILIAIGGIAVVVVNHGGTTVIPNK